MQCSIQFWTMSIRTRTKLWLGGRQVPARQSQVVAPEIRFPGRYALLYYALTLSCAQWRPRHLPDAYFAHDALPYFSSRAPIVEIECEVTTLGVPAGCWLIQNQPAEIRPHSPVVHVSCHRMQQAVVRTNQQGAYKRASCDWSR
jgi:hypothetical protein